METVLLFLSSLLVCVAAESDPSAMEEHPVAENPFIYDYESLRIGGLTFAVILFMLGILLILSRRCRCGGKQKPSRAPGDKEVQEENLIVSKAAAAAKETPAEN